MTSRPDHHCVLLGIPSWIHDVHCLDAVVLSQLSDAVENENKNETATGGSCAVLPDAPHRATTGTINRVLAALPRAPHRSRLRTDPHNLVYLGQAAKVIDASGARSAALNALPGDLASVLFLPYAVLLACWVLGSVWMAVCVLRSTTAFPRWMCAVNPLICIPVGALVTTLVPGSVGTAIQGRS